MEWIHVCHCQSQNSPQGNEDGYKAQIPREKTVLLKTMRKKRLEWAKVHKNWNISEWRQVIFSNESRFSLMSGKPDHVWRKAKEEHEARMPGSCIKTLRKRNGVGMHAISVNRTSSFWIGNHEWWSVCWYIERSTAS